MSEAIQTLYIENLTRASSDEMCPVCWFSMEMLTYSILKDDGVTGPTSRLRCFRCAKARKAGGDA